MKTLDLMLTNKELTTVEVAEQLSNATGYEIRIDERLDYPGAYMLTNKTTNEMYFIPENGLQTIADEKNLSVLRPYLLD